MKAYYKRLPRTALLIQAVTVLLYLFYACFPRQVPAEEATSQAKPFFITIATGPLKGLYYPAGRSICDLVNEDIESPRLLCSVERTYGSIANLKALAAGEVEFCIAQSDQLAAAYTGTAEFNNTLDDLRMVFALFEESLTVVVRADSDIRHITDLKHRKISTGFPGSGGYATMHLLMKRVGWNKYDIDPVDTISNARALFELCANRLDAVVFTAGHPYRPLIRAAEECELRLLNVRGPAVNRVLASQYALSRTVIPAGLYRGIEQPVKTIGVVATLVSSDSVDSAVVYRMLKSFNAGMDAFRQAHPIFGSVTRRSLIRDLNIVPLHDGAARYFRDAGMMK